MRTASLWRKSPASGMMMPARNAPKMAWMPMTWVLRAEARTTPVTAARTPSRVGLPEGRLAEQARERGLDDKEHQGDENEGESETEGGGTDTGGPYDGHHEGKDAPGGHVIDRRAGSGSRAEERLENPAVLQDADEDGKGGDADGNAHEQGEGNERGSRLGEMAVEKKREYHAEKIRDDDAGVADNHGGVRPVAQPGNIELHADGEHEEADADLAEEAKGAEGGGSKDELECAGREEAEEGRAEEDAGDHFSNDGGLAAAGEDPACGAGGGDDDEKLKEEAGEGVDGGIDQGMAGSLWGRGEGCCSCAGGWQDRRR